MGYCRIAHSDNHSITHKPKVACSYHVGITNIWRYCRVVWRDREIEGARERFAVRENGELNTL